MCWLIPAAMVIACAVWARKRVAGWVALAGFTVFLAARAGAGACAV